ncbi:hypothetical protein [Mycobacteroides abscessus]|nr:hypothetical protein [Mycobacteroides abscessus]
MAEATEAWNWYSCGPERRLDMVDDMIAAANSIPEGAPVGTVKQRPGAADALRRAGYGRGALAALDYYETKRGPFQ